MKAYIYQSGFYDSLESAAAGEDALIKALDSCDESADLIVLPESADMPFAPANRDEYVQAYEKYTCRLLKKASETARRCACPVFVNAADKTDGNYANTTFMFDKHGQVIGKYLKQHLTPGEVSKLRLESSYTYEYSEPYVIDYEGVRYAFLTCYDFYFYELLSFIGRKKPDIVIGCAQQRSDTHEAARINARFVAYNTGAYVLRSGVSLAPDSRTAGSSMAVAPDGSIITEFENETGFKCAEFDPHSKYLKPMGFMNPVGLHSDYIEKGRRPWKYRAAGSAIIPDNRTLPYPRICAHRGFSTVAPENSMPAFGAAIALGAQEIEFDLWGTADGEIVSLHDSTLDRVSDGYGKVYEKTLKELEELDFGSCFSEKFAGLRIVRFEDILRKYAGHVVMNVHIKDPDDHSPLDEVILRRIIALIDKYDNRRYVYFMTSNTAMLEQLGRLAPDIARCVGEREHFEIVNRAIDLGIDRVQLFKPYFNEEMIAKAKAHGIILNVFYADDPAEARRYIDMGIDCILTNDYLRIKNALSDIVK
ncbi:MAG: hypothetical protein IKR85_11450 [Clostridia bacterium]|nr:hypothetical protein [Clostridia bacterium]